MTTAIQIIHRSLRLIRVLDAGGAATADDAKDARDLLNTIGRRWLASGLIPAWTDATGPTSALVTATSADDALAYALAVKLAPEYGVQATFADQAKAETQTLWRDRLTAALADATANGLVLRALRTLAMVGQLPDAVSLPGALNTLNAMLAEWEGAGIGFTAPAYVALSSAVTLPDADHEAVSLQLALRLAPEYAIALPEPVMAQAASLLARLCARYSAPSY